MTFPPSLFVKDLDRIDSAIIDESAGVIGRSWYVDIQLSGELDSNGFIYDFSLLKTKIKNLIKGTLDHVLLAPQNLSALEIEEQGEFIAIAYDSWLYRGPKSGVLVLDCQAITTEILADKLAELAKPLVPPSITDIAFNLRDEVSSDSESFFCYTHGISGHQGNCQRLFHGHRSKIEIFLDGKRNSQVEASFLDEIMGRQFHIIGRDQITDQRGGSVEVSYTGSHGQFSGKIPANKSHILPGATSIEMITDYFFAKLKVHLQQVAYPYSQVELRCYEGIDKGSSVSE